LTERNERIVRTLYYSSASSGLDSGLNLPAN
jgi:hypothetical protein